MVIMVAVRRWPRGVNRALIDWMSAREVDERAQRRGVSTAAGGVAGVRARKAASAASKASGAKGASKRSIKLVEKSSFPE